MLILHTTCQFFAVFLKGLGL